MHSLRRTLIWSSVFSVAMGYLEAAVVIYLRKIYYPDGFAFPLVPIPADVGLVEVLREAATILMLAAVGIISGRTTAQRFALFVYCFAVWDIFYYVFLRIFDSWPASLLTWDILFLIPMPWVGPVLAPVIVSLTMIALTLVVIFAAEKDQHVRISLTSWLLLWAGALVIIYSFIKDYIRHLTENGGSVLNTGGDFSQFNNLFNYVPVHFSWGIFLAGELLLIAAIATIFLHIRRNHPSGIKARVPEPPAT
jgi:hypothetical protein